MFFKVYQFFVLILKFCKKDEDNYLTVVLTDSLANHLVDHRHLKIEHASIIIKRANLLRFTFAFFGFFFKVCNFSNFELHMNQTKDR